MIILWKFQKKYYLTQLWSFQSVTQANAVEWWAAKYNIIMNHNTTLTYDWKFNSSSWVLSEKTIIDAVYLEYYILI